MTEKITVNGKDVWVVVEAIDAQHGNPDIIPAEYFIASYNLQDPGTTTSVDESGNLFKDQNKATKRFLSPVEAIEYAVENLPGIV